MIYSLLYFVDKNLVLGQILTISKLELTMFFIFVFINFIFGWFIIFEKPRLVPRFFQLFLENLYEFVILTVRQQAGRMSQKFFPFFFILFLFILFSNVFGLIPGILTVTSHIFQTFEMSLSILVALTIIGFRLHGFRYFQLLLPEGAPKFLAPLLVIIELISYISRAFSLAIRLFANMMSGHTLLHILTSFCSNFFSLAFPLEKCQIVFVGGKLRQGISYFSFFSHLKTFIFFIAGLITLLIILGIFCLEIGIAALQAYVFIVLSSIYLKDSFKGGH